MLPDFPLDLAYAFGIPEQTGRFRVAPECFQVDEILGFEPEGEGEHLLLQVEKVGQNTAWVAKQLARVAGIAPHDVGYCGLKDRHAVTTQWFSLYLPGRVLPEDWPNEGITVKYTARHPRKLRRGQHAANAFRIQLQGLTDNPELSARLEQVRTGVPNYFGEQRFGRDGQNLQMARDLLFADRRKVDRHRRSLALSAVRAALFNRVLCQRVMDGTWQECLPGEPSTKPTGPLWGRGRNPAADDTGRCESEVLSPYGEWCDRLEHMGLKQERRPLICRPGEWRVTWRGSDLWLEFQLPPGQYATVVLREICQLDNAAI